MLSDSSSFTPLALLCCGLFLAAALYASVGHGGASGYLAVMGLVGIAPMDMKSIALTLNIAVSLLALAAFARSGHFRLDLFWRLAAVSVPAAFLGGWLQSSDPVFKIILAAALIFGAWRLVFHSPATEIVLRKPPMLALLGLGLLIGFLSGLIGIGGGIFLTPLLIFFHWSSAKAAAAVSAAFILVNSIAGLGGFFVNGGTIPPLAWLLLPFVLAGGWLGSWWGSGSAPAVALQRALAVILIIAATKFVII